MQVAQTETFGAGSGRGEFDDEVDAVFENAQVFDRDGNIQSGRQRFADVAASGAE
ncbi:MAG: hypothetical protein QM757_19370 [Paludibaculum sp.]